MVEAEAAMDKELNEKKTREWVFVNFSQNPSSDQVKAFVKYPDVQNFDPGYFIGNQIKIEKKVSSFRKQKSKDPNKEDKVLESFKWKTVCLARVLFITENFELCTEVDKKDVYNQSKGKRKQGGGHNNSSGFKSGKHRISFIWNTVPFDRMREGLAKIQGDHAALSKNVLNWVLGKPDLDKQVNISKEDILEMEKTLKQDPEAQIKYPEIKNIDAPNIPPLNISQKKAVLEALKNDFTLIQGPPGTGKTVTAAHLIYNLNKHMIVTEIDGVERVGAINTKILVSAPSNAASDILANKIKLTGANVVRVYSKKRTMIPLDSEIEKISLHCLSKDEDEQKKILDKAHIIVCTCSVSADDRLNKYKFRFVVVDESTQSVEPESILPLLRGSTKAVFIGDHMQLGPVVQDDYASQAGLKISFFSRMVDLGLTPTVLTIQYRMHP